MTLTERHRSNPRAATPRSVPAPTADASAALGRASAAAAATRAIGEQARVPDARAHGVEFPARVCTPGWPTTHTGSDANSDMVA
jgi:hypothetical protein